MAIYAIKSKAGCWLEGNIYNASIIARVKAPKKEEAIQKFLAHPQTRASANSIEVIPSSKLNADEKDWLLNYCEFSIN